MQIKESIIFKLLNFIELFKYEVEDELSKLGVHFSQFIAIDTLHTEDGITQSRLAELLNISPPSVNKTVLLLKNNKYLLIKTCSKDSRATRIFLTKKAKLLYPQLKKIWIDKENEFLIQFSDTEKILMRHLLEKVKSA